MLFFGGDFVFDLDNELKNLPELPGVYIMHDKDERVIYVGKAKVLKNRVRQYFQKSASHSAKVRAMVSNISYFEYIVTDSEIEALALECTLIKKYSPKYNILLKDDKQYPYIKVTINEEWPRIFKTRNLKNDGAKYFGPYVGVSTIKNTLDIIQSIFIPPTCSRKFPRDINKGRPCLNYHIKNCFAPCTGNVSNKEYRKVFFDICAFLEGNHKKLVEELTEQMRQASVDMQFEKAAALRDKIKAINSIDEKQKVVNSDKQNDLDVIAVSRDDDIAFVEIFFIRGGKLSGREDFRIDNCQDVSFGDITNDFIKQFYQTSSFLPCEILVQYEFDDIALVGEWISTKKGRKVNIISPKRGEKVRLVEMAEKNAKIALDNYKINKMRYEDRQRIASGIGELLGIEAPVIRIEAYDISNTSGADNVASMVVFENGKPLKSKYRKFRIKSFEGADDYRSMQEVIYRRLNEAREENEKISLGEISQKDAKFLPLPDVIFLDGGKGHISAVSKVLEMCETKIPVFGMVKDDKHRTRALLSEKGEISINPTSTFFHLITRIQDEVHRTAISYHRALHGKIGSELDKIKGVGEARRNALLTHFKSIDEIKSASLEELMNVNGITRSSAQNIYDYFNKN